ncbi:hypothetical protein [Streptomyces platensis]|uniref:hypothetical protein n=1 Tax=Streptomyces platensis TaxID=58346 RepID=UPI002E25838C
MAEAFGPAAFGAGGTPGGDAVAFLEAAEPELLLDLAAFGLGSGAVFVVAGAVPHVLIWGPVAERAAPQVEVGGEFAEGGVRVAAGVGQVGVVGGDEVGGDVGFDVAGSVEVVEQADGAAAAGDVGDQGSPGAPSASRSN